MAFVINDRVKETTTTTGTGDITFGGAVQGYETFAAGIGNPFFTTDSAAVLRAVEMKCDYIFKGTNVDGVYDKDPNKNKDAKKHHEITYTDVLRDNLKVMDMAAIAVARENNLPIKVFSIKQRGNFAKVLKDQGEYTIIRGN